ncbi:differentiation specific element binding protein [Tritrichomonas foetus]|uniref:Replication factor C subunit 1 n=1 Tax=Tritrichomonas foetus TaxID=1144522 RepID=A0A1J4J203_9EUKA|nr:differentiation specific element binding protein [Tritrichomonas foetus]|eukprot:OHS93402.1 differentiation specific element binding protein [Tritrichomonas foetus]
MDIRTFLSSSNSSKKSSQNKPPSQPSKSKPETSTSADQKNPQDKIEKKVKKPAKPNIVKAILPLPLPKPSPDFEFVNNSKSSHTDDPPHAGKVEIPTGHENCLNGITFTASGTLNSITRQQLRELISKYGGRLTASVSGKTDVFIRGVKDVGRKKLDEANEKGLPIIDEDGFFYILRQSVQPQNTASHPSEKVEETKKKISIHPSLATNKLASFDSQPKQIGLSVVSPIKVQPHSDSQPAIPPPPKPNTQIQLFTEKYRPKTFDELVGNKSAVEKLRLFLRDFEKQQKKGVLIYGPPGIGKTTAAVMCAKATGYHVIEFNASDTRNKATVEKIARDIFSNQTLFKYNNGQSTHLRSCIIFDEIDGMSTGDKGGIKALTDFMKNSRIPIICICNDRFNKKMSTLNKYVIDLPFSAPSNVEIAQRVSDICKYENISMNRTKYITLTTRSAGDIRSTLNSLQLWSNGVENSCMKDTAVSDPFDACVNMFKPQTKLEEKFDCFFVDYNSMPNYVHQMCGMNGKDFNSWFSAIDSMAYGSEMENVVRGENAWDMLNALAVTSSILPAVACPNAKKPPMYPNTFIKPIPDDFKRMATMNSHSKILSEISMRCRRSCGVSKNTFRRSIAEVIAHKLTALLNDGKEEEALEVLDEFELIKDDLENLKKVIEFGLHSIPVVGTATNNSFKKLYEKRHGAMKKTAYATTEEERADYFIRSMPKNRRGKK